ncbi:MAG: Gfo/Idh/MocA family protein [Armatimonadota bacterium]
MASRSMSHRRDFLRSAAVGTATLAMTAASQRRVLGANDRISIGIIGCGKRGFGAHMTGVHKHAEEQNVEITAVCDVWTRHLDEAAAKVQEWYGRAPRKFTAYQDLLALEDVDAVMIATPDFQHCPQLEAAAEAGKDAYCEKPLAMNMKELKSACDAVKAAGVVVQVGTQLRSSPEVVGCKKLFKTGVLGAVSRVEQLRNGSKPNWYKRLDRLPIEGRDVDWGSFLMHKRYRPFSDRLLAGWYGYREFCSGSIGQFGSHFIDMVHYITGAQHPSSAVAHGDTFIWKDEYEFDCPDQVQTELIYPEGFMLSYCTNFGNASGSRTVLYGTHGVMDFSNRSKPVVSGAGASEKGDLGAEEPVEPVECPDHFLNWLQCLRSREAPVAPIEAGYQHSVACILADRAWETGRRQVYNHNKREIRAG